MDPIDKGSDIENDTEDVDCFFIHEGDRIIDLPENGIELQGTIYFLTMMCKKVCIYMQFL